MIIGLGERMAQLRVEKRYTQKQVGAIIGATTSSVSAYERGETAPSLERAIRFCDAFHCSLEWLLTGKEFAKDSQYIDVSCLTRKQYDALKNLIEVLREKEKF